MQSVEELVDSVLAGVPAPVREGSTVASRLPHGLSHNTQYLESESAFGERAATRCEHLADHALSVTACGALSYRADC